MRKTDHVLRRVRDCEISCCPRQAHNLSASPLCSISQLDTKLRAILTRTKRSTVTAAHSVKLNPPRRALQVGCPRHIKHSGGRVSMSRQLVKRRVLYLGASQSSTIRWSLPVARPASRLPSGSLNGLVRGRARGRTSVSCTPSTNG